MTIPLIIPNFNQLYFTVNLINWWNYYTAESPVFILDNASTYKPLLEFYKNNHFPNVEVIRCPKNNCGDNLRAFIDQRINPHYKFYCISNPDIMPHPATPEFFLDLFRHCIVDKKIHHVGFSLIIHDLPYYIDNHGLIQQKESGFWVRSRRIPFKDHNFTGYIAPIDLTFAMYSVDNGGWSFPMNPAHWGNSMRILQAYHFGWYISPRTNIAEHINYFRTALTREKCQKKGVKIKGVNNYKPKTLIV
jgi:hypothetical protein